MKKNFYDQLSHDIEKTRGEMNREYWQNYNGRKPKKSTRSEEEKVALTQLAKAAWERDVEKIGDWKYRYNFPKCGVLIRIEKFTDKCRQKIT